MSQIAAAGGLASNTSGDAVLLVNDFNETHQLEAPNQPIAGRSIADYSMFTPYICPFDATKQVIGFADNRYSNGADVYVSGHCLIS